MRKQEQQYRQQRNYSKRRKIAVKNDTKRNNELSQCR